MKIVLIGGAGFIGHHAALDLCEDHDVTIIDSLMVNNLYSSDLTNKRLYKKFLRQRLDLLREADIPVRMIDARDYGMLSAVLGAIKPDVIVHLAAVAHIDRSNKDPYGTFHHNLRSMVNALDIAHNLGTDHFVFFSSSTVYGTFPSPVLDETSICQPFGIYGSLKYAGEHIVRSYGDTYDLGYTIVRPCAAYGPRCVSGRVGQKFIEAARQGQDITVFGDGEIYEDFTYVEDIVQGLRLIIEQRDKSAGETFNITAGAARSLNDLAKMIAKRYDVKIIYGEADPEKPHRGTMSVQKAYQTLGYNPQYQLGDGLLKYIEWYGSL